MVIVFSPPKSNLAQRTMTISVISLWSGCLGHAHHLCFLFPAGELSGTCGLSRYGVEIWVPQASRATETMVLASSSAIFSNKKTWTTMTIGPEEFRLRWALTLWRRWVLERACTSTLPSSNCQLQPLCLAFLLALWRLFSRFVRCCDRGSTLST